MGLASLQSVRMTKGSQITGSFGCRPAGGAGETVTCLHREDDGLLVLQGSVQLQHQGECLAPANHELRAWVLLGVVGGTVLPAQPVHLGDSAP